MNVSADPLLTLITLTQTLAQSTEIDPCLQAVTDAAMVLMACDHCSIRVFDESNEQLLAAARSGSGTAIRPVSFRVGEGVVGWVAAENRPLRIADTATDERFKSAAGQGFRIRSIVAAPLSNGARVVGVLSATSPTPLAFTERDEVLAQMLANLAVPSIERSRLELLALTDPVTLTLNRRSFATRLEEELDRARRYATPLSLVVLDVLGLEAIARQHGQDLADASLRALAQRLRGSVRRADLLVRRGSAQFAVIMPHTTREQASCAARRLKHEIDGAPVEIDGGIRIRLACCAAVVTAQPNDNADSIDDRCSQTLAETLALGYDVIGQDNTDEAPAPEA